MDIRSWSPRLVRRLWLGWTAVVVAVLATTLAPVMPDGVKVQTLVVTTPIGDAASVAGIALATLVTIPVLYAPVLILTGYWLLTRK